jgi:hypothetical protein
MNNVTPRPRRRALTGFEGSDDDDPEVPGFSGVFSGGLPGLFGPTTGLGRLRLGLVAVPVLAGLSFGREVMKAPRTSSSCAVTAIPKAIAQQQTKPKTMTFNRIAESPVTHVLCEKISHAKAQSAAAFPRFFFAPFAPLREIYSSKKC